MASLKNIEAGQFYLCYNFPMRKIFLLLAFFIPQTIYASLYINEISWMGDSVSASHEWIELRNNGSTSVALDGWTLEAEDGQPKIILEGIVSDGSFFLLERTSDESVPNITANQIYTGSLSNAGEVLMLKDSNGNIVDQVNGLDSWANIGGDNQTKETAQRASPNQWITASPTPKSQNVSTGQLPVNNESEETIESVQNGSTSSNIPASSSSKEIILPRIYAEAGENRTAISGADVVFSGVGYGYKKEILDKANYLWNFGDGAFGTVEKVTHAYVYPGIYIVSLNVSSGKDSASDYFTMTVIPNELVISSVNENYIAIKNGSPIRLDISKWIIETLGKKFIFPEGAFIKEKTEIFIPSSISSLLPKGGESVSFLYPNAKLAHHFKNSSVVETETKLSPATTEITQPSGIPNVSLNIQKTVTPASLENNPLESGGVLEAQEEIDSLQKELTASKEGKDVTASLGFSDFSSGWIFAVLVLGLLGGGGAVIARKFL